METERETKKNFRVNDIVRLSLSDSPNQEIYRPGTAISDASNLCTAVGGDQNKEFRGNALFLREKGPRGVFSILTRSQK